MEQIKLRFPYIAIAVLVLLNIFQILWFHFPLNPSGIVAVPDEETAIEIAKDTFSAVWGENIRDRVYKATFLESRQCWYVTATVEGTGLVLGLVPALTIRQADGKLIKLEFF